jgi:hypothetical protein
MSSLDYEQQHQQVVIESINRLARASCWLPWKQMNVDNPYQFALRLKPGSSMMFLLLHPESMLSTASGSEPEEEF